MMYNILHIPTALPLIEYVDFKHENIEVVGPLDEYGFGVIKFKTKDAAKSYLDQYNGGCISKGSGFSSGLLLNILGYFPIPSEHFEIVEVLDV